MDTQLEMLINKMREVKQKMDDVSYKQELLNSEMRELTDDREELERLLTDHIYFETDIVLNKLTGPWGHIKDTA